MKTETRPTTAAFILTRCVACMVMIVCLHACERQQSSEDVKSGIEQANQSWMQALKNGDATALSEMYAEDAYILPPNVPAIQGREGVKSFFASAMNAGIKDIKLVTQAVDGNGQTAIEKGTYEMRVEGDQVVDKGKYLVHWRNVDGKWMFQNDMFNSDMPVASAPPFQKGNVIGLHVATIKLAKGVTMDQFKDHYQTKVIPEFEKTYPDVKLYFIRGIRGEHPNRVGLIYFFESDEVRNKYFNADGTPNAHGLSMQQKMRPTYDELSKLRLSATTKYTDWRIE